ncbi:MAG TPA: aldo/keto reductase [Vicinamibacterales bacterium]|nr:aldo/keto reductase [Vicinamibacterales bacterium]
MQYRAFPRTGWQWAEIGYGTWGMAGWSGSDDAESLKAMERALELGCNVFDTAWAYGSGHSERLLRRLLAGYQDRYVYIATKVPPKNGEWPGRAEYPVNDVFPADHVKEYTRRSLDNLGRDFVDLQQLHVWSDAWAEDEGWQRAVDDLKREGLIKAFGISINRWEPTNVVKALRTGLVDAVQVVHNIFDQAPEDELFPLCQELQVAIISRVPFDEGSLTGTLTADVTFPKGDWRSLYFVGENLEETLERVERLKPAVPGDMTLPELALRYILEHPAVTTTIPGMRRVANVEKNLPVSDGRRLPPGVLDRLRTHRWDRRKVIP